MSLRRLRWYLCSKMEMLSAQKLPIMTGNFIERWLARMVQHNFSYTLNRRLCSSSKFRTACFLDSIFRLFPSSFFGRFFTLLVCLLLLLLTSPFSSTPLTISEFAVCTTFTCCTPLVVYSNGKGFSVSSLSIQPMERHTNKWINK